MCHWDCDYQSYSYSYGPWGSDAVFPGPFIPARYCVLGASIMAPLNVAEGELIGFVLQTLAFGNSVG
jgi:hypothetical protein